MSELTEAQVARLYEAAWAAYQNAYAPYSRFPVGAAVLGANGQIYAGCNVENAAYPEGTCAEAAALAAMVLNGQRHARAVLVLGGGETLVTPCGGCRQKLREFAPPQQGLEILIAAPGNSNGKYSPNKLRARFRLEELLPHSFGPSTLRTCSEFL